MSAATLVVGLGVTGRAVVAALRSRGHDVVATEDEPTAEHRDFAAVHGIELHERPDAATLRELTTAAASIVPSPGIPDAHGVFDAARRSGTPIRSELDLAGEWDSRPILAVTGTNGKTTVTELATRMLTASGIDAVAAGNTETPLVTAIDDPMTDVFVVEASSFRLGHTQRFTPKVATWLNFGPDHLDVHASLDRYEEAKASIWRDQGPDDVAVVNLDDPTVMRHRPTVPRVVEVGEAGEYHATANELRIGDEVLVPRAALWRDLPHDCFDVLAAAATVLPAGATLAGVREAIAVFEGLPHRVQLVGESGGVRWYDDSKATTPHAVSAAVSGFETVVLIAGGKNKGIDLRPLAETIDRIRAVIAIGDAATEVEAVFAAHRPVVTADSMTEAVDAAAAAAVSGDAVVLSPGCTSFDWYRNYGERGDDFARLVRALVGEGR